MTGPAASGQSAGRGTMPTYIGMPAFPAAAAAVLGDV